MPAAYERGGIGARLMAAGAKLFPASPKPAGGPVTPALRAPRVRFARAAKDARFQKVVAQLHQSSKKVAQHVPAKRKAAEAQAAAKAPPNEKEAGARANQVDEMKDAKAEKPNKGGFLAILRAEIEKVMPKNLDQADKFMKGGEGEQMKGAVGGNVSQQKEQAAGPTETATKAPPDTGKVEGKEVAALPADPAAAPPPVAGAEAMPAPKPAADVAKPAKEASASADQKLKDAELNDQQLKKANDPRFSSVLTTRDKAKETAAAGPAKYRANEQKALVQAQAGARGDAGKGVAGLAATKTATSGKTKTRQQLAKEKDEAERKKVTDTIAGIFEKTKTKVEQKLSTLETDAMALFDAGADAALANMKNGANEEIAKFKEERYSGIIGKGRWLKDLFSDTPPEIKAIIARARARFTVEMDAVAVRVANIVDSRLAEAKAIVAAGQAEVKRYVAGLAPNLRSVGQKAEQDMAARFDELKNSIDEKANDLAEKLAQKYKDASEKADAAAKAIEDANKGALKALADKVGEILKILADFADRVVSLFKKAAGVVKKIIADPIGFLGNLLSAIKQGISRFVSNIWTHIKKGFITWLFGELTKAGVEIPSDLSLPSILKLVLGVLGLTWANIRPKIVKKIGERAVSVLEKVVEMLQKLFTSGPAALWEEMKAFLGNLKQMVIDAILEWVITKVITSAITKIASMFNPAGAIIQAIVMVYNVGAWLVNNISRILDFIESVVNSVDRIANGDVGGAAAFIEQALARMIPILIGFLASLIGLGGLSAKVKSFIEKVQAQVSKAVDFVIDKIFNFVKKLVGSGKGGDKKKDEKPDAAGEVVETPVSMKGSAHTLAADAEGNITIASAKGKLSTKLGKAITKVKAESPTTAKLKAQQTARAGALTTLQTKADAAEKKIKKDKIKKKVDKKTLLDPIVVQIKDYAEKYGAKDIDEVLPSEFPKPEVGSYDAMVTFASKEAGDPAKKLPDDTKRVPHHAPPVELGVALQKALQNAGTSLDSDVPGSGVDLLTAASKLAGSVKGHGGKLPTILVHVQTHRTKPGITARIHGSEIKAALLTKLTALGFGKKELVLTKEDTVSVNPGKRAFERQGRRIGRAETGAGSFAGALKKDAKAVVQKMYAAAAAQAIGAVQIALSGSVLDGPSGARDTAVAKLTKLAKTVWQDGMLGSLF